MSFYEALSCEVMQGTRKSTPYLEILPCQLCDSKWFSPPLLPSCSCFNLRWKGPNALIISMATLQLDVLCSELSESQSLSSSSAFRFPDWMSIICGGGAAVTVTVRLTFPTSTQNSIDCPRTSLKVKLWWFADESLVSIYQLIRFVWICFVLINLGFLVYTVVWSLKWLVLSYIIVDERVDLKRFHWIYHVLKIFFFLCFILIYFWLQIHLFI